MADPAITLRLPTEDASATKTSSIRNGLWTYLMLTVIIAAAILALSIFGASMAGVLRIDTINSGSMAPVIPRGSDVFVSPEPVSALKVGQVIAFTPPRPYPQITVVHEVVGVKRALGMALVTTRGIANTTNDPWKAVVRGRVWHVVGSIQGLGYITNFMRIGIVQLIVALLVIGALFTGVGRLVTLVRQR